jgi:hypothetical protein
MMQVYASRKFGRTARIPPPPASLAKIPVAQVDRQRRRWRPPGTRLQARTTRKYEMLQEGHSKADSSTGRRVTGQTCMASNVSAHGDTPILKVLEGRRVEKSSVAPFVFFQRQQPIQQAIGLPTLDVASKTMDYKTHSPTGRKLAQLSSCCGCAPGSLVEGHAGSSGCESDAPAVSTLCCACVCQAGGALWDCTACKQACGTIQAVRCAHCKA